MKACSVCKRKDRAKIDRELAAGSSLSSIASRHRGASRSALQRHHKHAAKARKRTPAVQEPAAPAPASELRPIVLAESVARYIHGRLRALEADPDLSEGDRARVLASLSTALGRVSKLTGEGLDLKPAQIVRTPAFKAVVEDLTAALAPYPDAMLAVAEALEAIERGERPAAAAPPPGGSP